MSILDLKFGGKHVYKFCFHHFFVVEKLQCFDFDGIYQKNEKRDLCAKLLLK